MKSTPLPTVPRRKLNSLPAHTQLKPPGKLPSLQRTFVKTAMRELRNCGKRCALRVVWIAKQCLNAGKGFLGGDYD